MRGDQLLVETLAKSGVETIFSLSGNQIMPVYDACIDHNIRIIHTRHESSAVFMAESWAQLTGRCGIALVTAAPGFANALGAVYSSLVSHTPIVLLSGDSPIAMDGRGAFQEFPQTQAATPFVKHSERIAEAGNIPSAIENAIALAQQDPPGPVHLALPFDLLTTEVEDLASTGGVGVTDQYSLDRGMQSVFDALMGAMRPLVFTGPQLNRTRQTLVSELENKLCVPVLCMESPRGLNDPALGLLNEIIRKSDRILYLGKEVNFQTGFASIETMPRADFLFVHPDKDSVIKAETELGERLKLSKVSNSLAAARGLIESAGRIGIKGQRDWLKEVRACIATRTLTSRSPEPAGDPATSTPAVHPEVLGKVVNKLLQSEPESILICDGGEFGQWAQGFVNARQRVINGASGAIGGSIPYAIGACIANPGATVVAMLGDGTAGFYLAEFETAVRAKVNPVYVIGNDSRWNAEHQIQIRDYGVDRAYACELSETADYAACAAALGGIGLVVDNEAELEETISQAIRMASQQRLPVCVNVVLDGLPAPVYQSR